MGTRRLRDEEGSPVKDEQGRDRWVPAEMWTVHLAPVYGNSDPNHENTKFWEASPVGSIQLGTVNAAAVAQFTLEAEFFVDFTEAEK